MVRIQINEDIELLAKQYSANIPQKKRDEIFSALDHIVEEADLPNGNVTIADLNEYIMRIKDNYDKLLVLHPSEFKIEIGSFEKIIRVDDINEKLLNNGKESISSKIVKAMQYNSIRKKIYPPIIRELRIKTCVYCNANYAITDALGSGYYDLDHWKPQSYYPYLCTSFYNLQPSCPSCNKRKGNKKDNEYFHLWNDSDEELEVFKFQLDPKSITEYLLKLREKKLDYELLSILITEASSRYTNLVRNAEKCFYLNDIYREHRDVAEEIVWKKQIYNNEYYFATERLLNKIGIHSESSFKSILDRFIMGNYCELKDVHKRPLSKMTRDIGIQLGLI